jgi:hypothetical protein
MILRLDEILNQKVNKHAFDALETYSRSLAKIDLVAQKEVESVKRSDLLRHSIESFRSEYLFFTHNLQKEISNIVRRQTANIRN